MKPGKIMYLWIHSTVRLSMQEQRSCTSLSLSVYKRWGSDAWISQLLALTKTQQESDRRWFA